MQIGSTLGTCDSIVVWALDTFQVHSISTSTDALPLKFVVPSYYSNPNLNAQKGVLTHWEITAEPWTLAMYNPPKIIDRTPLDELISLHCNSTKDTSTILYKFEFPASDCIECFKCITSLGYTASKLFPGYAGITRELEELSLLIQLQSHEIL